MLSERNGTMERKILPRPKTVRQTRNKDAAHANKRVTVPLTWSLHSVIYIILTAFCTSIPSCFEKIRSLFSIKM